MRPSQQCGKLAVPLTLSIACWVIWGSARLLCQGQTAELAEQGTLKSLTLVRVDATWNTNLEKPFDQQDPGNNSHKLVWKPFTFPWRLVEPACSGWAKAPAGEDRRPVMSACQNGSGMKEQILWTESLEIQTLAKQPAEGVLELRRQVRPAQTGTCAVERMQ